MSIELSDHDLAELAATVTSQLNASRVEYLRLRAVIAEKFSSVTSEAIGATQAELLSGSYHAGGQAADHAAFCCAFYLLTGRSAEFYVRLIEEGRASAEVVLNLIVIVPQAWAALGALAVVLNGFPLAQSFIDQRISQLRSASAARAADSRHAKPGGSRDKREQIQAIWASGKYGSRDRCADAEHGKLRISFSAARRALRGTPEPDRT